jgi:hypothetical protein
MCETVHKNDEEVICAICASHNRQSRVEGIDHTEGQGCRHPNPEILSQ